MSIEVVNESGMDVDEPALAGVARHVLSELRIHPLAELSVLVVDSATMADLHQRWLGEPGPTDVLAFPMDELRPPPPGSDRSDRSGGRDSGPDPGLLGDVVLCPEVAAAQAKQAQHSTADELDLLCTHGILHLLGFDHAETEDRTTMFGLQDRLLASWRAARDDRGDGGPSSGGQPERGESGSQAARGQHGSNADGNGGGGNADGSDADDNGAGGSDADGNGGGDNGNERGGDGAGLSGHG